MGVSSNKKKITSATRFFRYYLSVAGIIFFLAVANQTIIQYTLVKEVVARNTATQLGRQQKRAGAIQTDALNLVNRTDTNGRVQYVATLIDHAEQLQQFQNAALHGDRTLYIPNPLPADAASVINRSTPDYQAIHDATEQIIAIESQDYTGKKPPTIQIQLQVIQQHLPAYQADFTEVYNDLSRQADTLVGDVRLIEFILFLITPALLVYELFFVVKPAVSMLQSDMVLRTMVQPPATNEESGGVA